MIDALDWAIRSREPLLGRLEAEGTDACRLFTGESEGIAGLIADKYAGVIILQYHEGKCRLTDDELKRGGEWLLGRLPAESVYLKRFVPDRSHSLASEELYSAEPLAGEKALQRFEIRESGARYWIQPYGGFSTGLFLDQRENRRFLASRGKGKEVLNCFAYTCAFSVSTALQNAETTSVDISRKYLEWGRENFLLNGIDPTGHHFVAEDAFVFLKRAAKRDRKFDLVILDPPSFSRGKSGVFSVKKDLGKLLEAAFPVVKPGGELFFSTNFSEWTTAYLRKLVTKVAGPREYQLETLPPLPEDFRPQGNPLSAVLMKIG